MSSKKSNQKKGKPVKFNIVLPKPKPVVILSARHQMQQAAEYPILGCWIYAKWQEAGIAPIVVARQQAPDLVLFSVFMIDVYCLGVKDAMYKVGVSRRQFENLLPKICQSKPLACEVDFAHEFIYGAVEYARRYGFEPHPDYRDASLILDAPDAHPRRHQIEFGKNGKPFYVNGPFEDQNRIQKILHTLERTAGPGNYNFMIGQNPDIDSTEEFLLDDLDFEDEEPARFLLGKNGFDVIREDTQE